MATGTTERPSPTTELRTSTTAARREPTVPRGSRLAIPRSRGLLSGLVLVILGVWGGLVPFVGPYFGYEFGTDQAWAMSWNRLWLDVLPGIALVLGGLVLISARNRLSGAFGGWLALAGGAWFIAGPTVALLWDGALGANPIGVPVGSNGVQVLELLGYFYALGALAVAFSAFALGRLSVVGVRDVEAARATTTDGYAPPG